MEELIGYDAIALGRLVRGGEIHPVELLDSTIQRIEKINPKLNAVIHKMYDQARETAEGWSAELSRDPAAGPVFCGVPFLLKGSPCRIQIAFLTSVPEGWSAKVQVHPDCVNAVKDAARLCEDLGHIVEEIVPNQLGDHNILQNYGCI